MAISRWTPLQAVTRQEHFILKRLTRNGKLFAFLRLHRHEIFDDGFQSELESMYRDTGAGKDLRDHPRLRRPAALDAHGATADRNDEGCAAVRPDGVERARHGDAAL